MIDRIVVENFKSLRRVDLRLGRMNLFVGANASGKSNFLDLLRVLQGIGNGFTIGEILDGKPRSATSEVWDGIRGGSRLACFAALGENRGCEEMTIEVHGTFGGGRVGEHSDSSTSGCSFLTPTARGKTQWRAWRLTSTPEVSRCSAVQQSRRSRSASASGFRTICLAVGRMLARILGWRRKSSGRCCGGTAIQGGRVAAETR